MKHDAKAGASAKTLERYQEICRNHLIPTSSFNSVVDGEFYHANGEFWWNPDDTILNWKGQAGLEGDGQTKYRKELSVVPRLPRVLV